jgi:DNA-binding transcriptional LysR family regulator
MFSTVARSGGFTRASEELHVSHSAISRQIKLLEDELGSALFTRANKKVALTESGKALLPYADAIFAQCAEALRRVSEMTRGPAKRLNIGTGTTMVNLFLPSVLQQFREQHPSVAILIKTGHAVNILEDIRSGDLDLGIVTLPVDSQGLAINRLYREELVIAGRGLQALAAKKIIQPKELEKMRLIVYSRRSSTRTVLDHFFRNAGINPMICMEVENDEAAERAISTGAVCFLPAGRAKQDRIHFVRVSGHPIYREVGLVYPSSPPGHVASFLTLCNRHAASFEYVV